ncbi:glycosyltransferase WbsX family protein [Rhodoferax antarcticus]|uniref:glycosyltransferase WbsX family protein n=1 Tax=Rhodoferax antarcticus TaxID=81479 RepID=UPI0022251393|nr:glycoside hydrolase family 99-like domain-containing protein [Rhodoferax antarcticus]MCW2312606.1 hypothetical protein [Rhodoferax antarcticus]
MEIIAYYLPQYYPFRENDEWWGEGFTEWTNVGKANRLYRGHYQPKVPANLGYYDLRLPEVRSAQVNLAIEAGVTGFCYWHYWFGNGKQLLDMPFKEVLLSGKPDFPFCLGWANESWKAKVWSGADGSSNDKLLIEQLYPGLDDIEAHFYSVLPAFNDKRYIKIDGKPIFVIYKPLMLHKASEFIAVWNRLAKLNNIPGGIFFIGHTVNVSERSKITEVGFDAVNVVRVGEYRFNKDVIKKIPYKLFKFKFFGSPLVINYSFISQYFVQKEEIEEDLFPTLIPNWDHTPRSGRRGVVFHNSTPELFNKHAKKVIDIVKNKKRQIIFLKSWNEWGEGNYMEPDLKYGKKYINALSQAIADSCVTTSK